jgi:hypothetical protein
MKNNGKNRTMEVKVEYEAPELLQEMKKAIINGEFDVYSP